jgi:hypothetical protein
LCGGGVKMSNQAILRPPPPTQEADSPPKQADLVKVTFSHVTVGPKVAKGPDVASHMTSADLGSKLPFSRKFLNEWVLQETFLAKCMQAIFINLTAVSKSARLFPVGCENDFSVYIVNPHYISCGGGKTPS